MSPPNSQKVPLPPRKRKFSATEFDSSNLPQDQSKTPSGNFTNTDGGKRRRTAAHTAQSAGPSRAGVSDSQSKKASADKQNTSLQEGGSSRRSSRGSYPLGFYAEEEQKCFAAYRDRTSELRSSASTRSSEQLSTRSRKSSKRISDSLSGFLRNTRSVNKMSDRRLPDLSEGTVDLDNTRDNRASKAKSHRRHTLPGKTARNSDMGVSLSKCLPTGGPQANQDQAQGGPSSSGLNVAGHPDTASGSVIDHLMRKLPLRKKSNSEQDLQQIEMPGAGTSKDSKRPDDRRRRSANLEAQQNKNSSPNRERRDMNSENMEYEQLPGATGGPFKLYPLRNRLRVTETPNSASAGGSVYGCPTPPATTDPNSFNLLGANESQSLPSSPSSGGGAFLDTFRGSRNTSRRLSHEPQPSGSGSNRRNQQGSKDNKQGSGPWKRAHGIRKSPLSSKRSSRGSKGSGQSTASGATNQSGRVKSAGSLMSQLLPGRPHFNRNASHPMTAGMASLPMNVSVPSIPIPATSGMSGLSAAGSNPTSLTSSALGSIGAMANANLASGSSSSTSNSMSLANSLLVVGDLDGEESEMGRLEALLASRGLPPSLFGALGPRMQHILHRSVSSSITAKAQQLLLGLQAADESEQLQAVIEMCQLLVMGNEDTLMAFPIKQVTPALINLLNMEHNFDMMNHACRALTYMMEALPRSSVVVVEAVPAFLEKLQSIQCMDVAEQSLTALHMLSKKHSKAILHAHGVASCLMFLDFFSINAQRNALGITANCFQSLTADDFHYAVGSLQSLSSRLTTQGDKKCVESVCLAYSRVVDCFHADENRLHAIAEHDLMSNIQQLLVMSPPVLSTGTFVMVIRMLSTMCANCPDLAVRLLDNNIAQTLCYLLTNSTDLPTEQIDLVARTPQELFEITALISELMPVLPSDGIFSIDAAIVKPLMIDEDVVIWQWQDDRGVWHNYFPSDSRNIEAGHQSEDYDMGVVIHGTNYTLDFHSMQQINENTGTTRAIQRKLVPSGSGGNPAQASNAVDARSTCLKSNEELASTLIKSLFTLLHEVYSSSAGPTVRYKCLRAMLRMVHFSSPELLEQVLKSQAVSSHLAAMLSSPDNKIIVGALQMTSLLMEKLPQIFSIYFRREGVMHQIKRLVDQTVVVSSPRISHLPTRGSSNPTGDSKLQEPSVSSSSTKETEEKSTRIGDVLRQKKKQGKSKGSNASGSKDTWKISSGNRSRHGGSSGSRSSSFLSSFNPAKWGRASVSHNESALTKQDRSHSSAQPLNCQVTSHYQQSANTRETIKSWIHEQATKLYEKYFSSDVEGVSHPALTILNKLMEAVSKIDLNGNENHEALTSISEIVKESDISPFEVIHSGLVRALLSFLTSMDSQETVYNKSYHPPGINYVSDGKKHVRDVRLLQFLNVFLGCSMDRLSVAGSQPGDTTPFAALVNKLNGCVNQLEQFPVKVHDLPGSALSATGRSGSTSAIKFFNTHQLKCNLQRHRDCTHLRQWRGGPVKVDPLALVQAIEKYLVIRGYGRVRDEDEDNSDDDNSDEEIDDALTSVAGSQSSSGHKLQFLIGNNVLPYTMTVYQAIKVYGSQESATSENETDSDVPISHSAIWLETHTIYYRSVQPETQKSGRKGKASSKHSPKKKDSSASEASIYGGGGSTILDSKLVPYLPASVSVRDPSSEVLTLLRILYGINRHYGCLYPPGPFRPPLASTDFFNSKLTAKANRQLQDPLVIMTGNLPHWLPQIVYACPFMFPFETRQLLFYAVTFDRDRTLQRLLEASPEMTSSDSTERVTPRLERRKRTVNRDDILKQGETVFNELATSKAMLEIQYENEVGTGLGPTLEFYALISRELQKAELELWRGDSVTIEESPKDKATKSSRYVCANNGLFPQPIPKSMKSSQVTKLKNKFKFLGKLMAKAVMDSRMLDVRLHECVYKWLLSEERSLGLADIITLDPVLGQTLSKLQAVMVEKKRLQLSSARDADSADSTLQEQIEALTIDGCKVQDLSLNFTLPGYPNIELKRGGSDIEVTINNIEQYMQLVVDWLLRDGVWRQMDALREGFESVFPVERLQVFYPEELEQLFCGSIENQQWDMKQLAECCRPDHGYNHSSKAVKFLLQILAEYGPQQQRSFLQFVTGSPRLPVGGFKSLSPQLAIVRKTFAAGEDPDQFLPSVMTCVNYLKLPDYSTIEIMREKLDLAAREGQHSFHLS